jgi:ABC-type Na+ efflux pump permease subunit
VNLALAIFGGVLGLLITCIAFYTAWIIHQLWRQQAASPRALSNTDIAMRYLSKWTMLDYAVSGLFVIGLLLLAVDLLAVLRDKASYPPFHLAYLLCGIVFSAMGMLLLLLRLALVLSFAKSKNPSQSAISPQHHYEPSEAHQSE